MSLSVSSFPEAPTTPPVQKPKWQVTSSLKSSGRFLGTLRKRSVPFLKGVGHSAKIRVKGSIIRQRANVLRSRSLFKSLTGSPNRPSSIVIDIAPTSNNNKSFSATSSDADASSLNPTIEISFSPTISPTTLSTPTTVKDSHALSPTDPVKAPFQSSVQSLVGDNAHAHETAVQPAKEHEEVASDSEPHDPPHSDSEIVTPLPISPSPTTQSSTVPVTSTEGRRRSHSASAGVKVSAATKTVLKTLTRYKSETAIGLSRRLTNMTRSDDPSPSQGKDPNIGENQIPPSPALGSTQASKSTSTKKRIFKRARARSGASSKSTGSSKAVESPSASASSAGSRLSANSRRPSTASFPQAFSLSTTALVPKLSPEQMDLLQAPPSPHLLPKTSDVAAASPQIRSRSLLSLVEGSGPPREAEDVASEQSPLPSSVDRGLWLRLAAVPHAASES